MGEPERQRLLLDRNARLFGQLDVQRLEIKTLKKRIDELKSRQSDWEDGIRALGRVWSELHDALAAVEGKARGSYGSLLGSAGLAGEGEPASAAGAARLVAAANPFLARLLAGVPPKQLKPADLAAGEEDELPAFERRLREASRVTLERLTAALRDAEGGGAETAAASGVEGGAEAAVAAGIEPEGGATGAEAEAGEAGVGAARGEAAREPLLPTPVAIVALLRAENLRLRAEQSALELEGRQRACELADHEAELAVARRKLAEALETVREAADVAPSVPALTADGTDGAQEAAAHRDPAPEHADEGAALREASRSPPARALAPSPGMPPRASSASPAPGRPPSASDARPPAGPTALELEALKVRLKKRDAELEAAEAETTLAKRESRELRDRLALECERRDRQEKLLEGAIARLRDEAAALWAKGGETAAQRDTVAQRLRVAEAEARQVGGMRQAADAAVARANELRAKVARLEAERAADAGALARLKASSGGGPDAEALRARVAELEGARAREMEARSAAAAKDREVDALRAEAQAARAAVEAARGELAAAQAQAADGAARAGRQRAHEATLELFLGLCDGGGEGADGAGGGATAPAAGGAPAPPRPGAARARAQADAAERALREAEQRRARAQGEAQSLRASLAAAQRELTSSRAELEAALQEMASMEQAFGEQAAAAGVLSETLAGRDGDVARATGEAAEAEAARAAAEGAKRDADEARAAAEARARAEGERARTAEELAGSALRDADAARAAARAADERRAAAERAAADGVAAAEEARAEAEEARARARAALGEADAARAAEKEAARARQRAEEELTDARRAAAPEGGGGGPAVGAALHTPSRAASLTGASLGVPQRSRSGGVPAPRAEETEQELAALRNLVTCSICRVRLKRKILKTCRHVFCAECVEANLESRNRKCPGCGKAFSKNDVEDFFFT